MEKFKFTDTALRKLPLVPRPAKGAKGPKDSFGFDTETSRFALRVTYESKIFYFQHRDKKGPFRKKLGNFPDISTKAARALVDGLNGDVARGVDLRALEEAKKVKAAAEVMPAGFSEALTLGQLLESWAATPSENRRQSYIEKTVAVLKRDLAGLLELPIDPAVDAAIKAKIKECLRELSDRPASRRVAGQKLRALCRWGVDEELISSDPTQGIKLGGKSRPRQVHLDGQEARLVWRVAGTLPPPYGQAIQYLMASGLRLREGLESRRREFSPDFSEQLVEAERMKEGQAHIVYLPPALRQMLRELPVFQGSDLIFTRDGKTPISGVSHLKRRLDRALAKSGAAVKPFTFHDLRRTITTHLVRSGVSEVVADRLLAHKGLGEIAATYNVHKYESERRAALEKWVDFLTGGEAVAIPGPTPQRALPAPDSAPLDGDLLPSVAESNAILKAYYGEEGLTSGVVVTQSSRPPDRDNEDNRVWRRIADMLLDPGVARVVPQMLRAKLAPAFAAKHARDANKEAVKFMAHCAARWAIERKSVHKPEEVKAELDSWKERIRDARDDARNSTACRGAGARASTAGICRGSRS